MTFLLLLVSTLAAFHTADAVSPLRTSNGTPADTLALTLDHVFREAGGVREVSVAPDGRWVAVVGQGPDGTGIYLHEIGGPQPDRIWMQGRSPAWSPDGRHVAFVSRETLWVAEAGSDEATVRVQELPGLRNPVWSPEGRRIAFYASESGSQDIWVVDAFSAGPPRQITRGAAELDDPRFSPAWSPDGAWIAYISNRADWWHDDVWLVRVESGEARQLSRHLMASSSPVFSPDGRDVVLMGTAKDEYWYEDLSYLYRIRLENGPAGPRGAGEAPIEMQVFASDFIMRFDPFFSEDGSRIFFPYHERGAFDLWAVPLAGGVATRVTHLGGAWHGLSGAAGRIAIVREGWTEGPEAWTLTEAGGPARRITAFSPVFRGVQQPREISFRSFDGLYIQGFLYLPPRLRDAGREVGSFSAGGPPQSSIACPALVQVHGGGTNSYYQGRNLVEQYLASRGFAVLAVNYRGGSGFGRSFQDLAVEDWLNDQSRDPGAASDWLRQQPWASGKVGIYGGSYGGMQTMSALTRTPDKFDAAVPMRGIYSTSLTLPFADRLGKIFTITGHGGTPEARPEIYEKSHTLGRFEAITAPVLIMHGERDVRAPFRNYELAVERLEALGKEYEAVTYPEGHGFRDPANSIDMYRRLEEFFVRHIGAGCL